MANIIRGLSEAISDIYEDETRHSVEEILTQGQKKLLDFHKKLPILLLFSSVGCVWFLGFFVEWRNAGLLWFDLGFCFSQTLLCFFIAFYNFRLSKNGRSLTWLVIIAELIGFLVIKEVIAPSKWKPVEHCFFLLLYGLLCSPFVSILQLPPLVAGSGAVAGFALGDQYSLRDLVYTTLRIEAKDLEGRETKYRRLLRISRSPFVCHYLAATFSFADYVSDCWVALQMIGDDNDTQKHVGVAILAIAFVETPASLATMIIPDKGFRLQLSVTIFKWLSEVPIIVLAAIFSEKYSVLTLSSLTISILGWLRSLHSVKYSFQKMTSGNQVASLTENDQRYMYSPSDAANCSNIPLDIEN